MEFLGHLRSSIRCWGNALTISPRRPTWTTDRKNLAMKHSLHSFVMATVRTCGTPASRAETIVLDQVLSESGETMNAKKKQLMQHVMLKLLSD